MKQYLECGKIVSTHGIHGELKVQPWCDSPEYLCGFGELYFDKGNHMVKVVRSRPHKGMVLMTLEGVSTIDDAADLRGRILYLNRDDATGEDGYFIQDLIGLTVKDTDSAQVYGTLSDVIETGANDVYSVKAPGGKELLVPAIPDVVIEINLEDGYMKIRPLEGLFDNAD